MIAMLWSFYWSLRCSLGLRQHLTLWTTKPFFVSSLTDFKVASSSWLLLPFLTQLSMFAIAFTSLVFAIRSNAWLFWSHLAHRLNLKGYLKVYLRIPLLEWSHLDELPRIELSSTLSCSWPRSRWWALLNSNSYFILNIISKHTVLKVEFR